MALTVETGSLVSNPDSYVELATYQAYGAARGWTLSGTDAADEQNLRRAFDTINRKWEYVGVKIEPITQVPAFPRYIVKSRWEYETPPDDIPWEVEQAQMELAYLIQGGLDPFETITGRIKRERVGPLETEYTDGGEAGDGSARLVAVEGLLRPFLASGLGQTKAARG